MKQRLIDANALDWVDIEEEYGKRTEEVVACEVLIENAPTIEAIPIELVKKFRNQFEPGDDDYNLIDGLLNIWRLENETN